MDHLQNLIRVGMCVSAQTPLLLQCYKLLASFRNYVSTSRIGSATFFLSRLVIRQRGLRSCSLGVRSRFIYQAVSIAGEKTFNGNAYAIFLSVFLGSLAVLLFFQLRN